MGHYLLHGRIQDADQVPGLSVKIWTRDLYRRTHMKETPHKTKPR